VAEEKGPFNGIMRQIPGIIQAEDYDAGGEGFAYHDVTSTNEGSSYRTTEGVDIEVCSEGGFDVGWTANGEWLSYTVNVDSTMNYDLDIRAAVNAASVISLSLSNGNVSTGDISLAASGGWTSWKTYTKKGLSLNKGIQEMKINVAAGFNLNYIKLSRVFPLQVNRLSHGSEISIFPNPATDFLSVSSVELIKKVVIFDLLGKELRNISLNRYETEISVRDLQPGCYLITTESAKGKQVDKFFKK
jgi:hypothetical protein